MNHVLVVDDDAGIRRLTTVILRLQGVSVEVAENGQEAYDAIQQSTPDVMVLDLSMPVMDGATLVHKLDADAAPRPPTLLLSAYDPENACKRLGVEACLAKPFEPLELINKVQALLDKA